jgi:hypothetical protein
MEAVCLSLTHHLTYHELRHITPSFDIALTLLSIRPPKLIMPKDNMYRTVISLYPTTSIVVSQADRWVGCYDVAKSILMVSIREPRFKATIYPS